MMNRILFLLCVALVIAGSSRAQVFISKATIEFEVKTNIKKTMGTNTFDEIVAAQLPDYKTGYFLFSFADNKSIYRFSRWDDATKRMPEWFRSSEEDNKWYYDHSSAKFNMQKNLWGSNLNVDDSIPVIKWKLSNESRVIAGFNCRKATGVIMDSVYVFAFYTDEIMIPGGPCSINGLPGMILGLTIPRLYTSFIATKVMVNDVDMAAIKPVAAKKYYTNASLRSYLLEKSKDWGNSDDPDGNKWREMFRWNALL